MREDSILRHYRLAVSLQLAVMLAAPTVAWSQAQTAAADPATTEHVRHLRSRKAVKPTLSAEEDKVEAAETAEPATRTAEAPKSAAEASKASAPRPKKIATKPAPAKAVAAKPRAAGRQEIARPAVRPAPAEPASRGFLEEIFGDN